MQCCTGILVRVCMSACMHMCQRKFRSGNSLQLFLNKTWHSQGHLVSRTSCYRKEITSKVSCTCVYNFIFCNELTPLLVVSLPGQNVKVELGLAGFWESAVRFTRSGFDIQLTFHLKRKSGKQSWSV